MPFLKIKAATYQFFYSISWGSFQFSYIIFYRSFQHIFKLGNLDSSSFGKKFYRVCMFYLFKWLQQNWENIHGSYRELVAKISIRFVHDQILVPWGTLIRLPPYQLMSLQKFKDDIHNSNLLVNTFWSSFFVIWKSACMYEVYTWKTWIVRLNTIIICAKIRITHWECRS